MIAQIESHRPEIEALCRKYRVAYLEVFGTAATADFDPRKSDIDFLVTFEPLETGPLASAYFGLLSELGRVFGRHVDLVTPGAIRNPYFRQGIDNTRKLIYAA